MMGIWRLVSVHSPYAVRLPLCFRFFRLHIPHLVRFSKVAVLHILLPVDLQTMMGTCKLFKATSESQVQGNGNKIQVFCCFVCSLRHLVVHCVIRKLD